MATEMEILHELVEDLAKFGKRLDRVQELEAEVEKMKAEREDASALGDERICRLEKERDKLRTVLEEIGKDARVQSSSFALRIVKTVNKVLKGE